MEAKNKSLKSFNKTKNGKNVFIFAIIGMIMLMIGGFLSGFYEEGNVNIFVKVVINLVPILGGYFVGIYVGSFIEYAKKSK